ncbi:YneF family protein [Aerococcaceae bacterium zg-ZJ1578]|uniref:YneF family protein n=1 Tax=Aerococcaceae TaxID=186827 RepID=UPI0013B9D028|nr:MULTISPECIES: YneF family protein [unclassified Facklamia]MBK0348525.1 YneF family protein [Aerococcaceae bacterium zg-1578]MBR7928145.1 YneF family protein [Aerococcaceae bacterium zg-ZUI334]MBS4462716.1 YneF family protein [Aerococcaceae bacterium zg-B36]QQD66162.1 YneF family protein [Aerococcaceae bacterium zg-252]NEW65256.1 YneF family protein [Facklamia sp. 252]
MPTWIWLLIVLIALIAGFVAGFFMARRYMMNYFKENPPIDERMITMMMAQMGQKPSRKKVQQIMQSMKVRQ